MNGEGAKEDPRKDPRGAIEKKLRSNRFFAGFCHNIPGTLLRKTKNHPVPTGWFLE
jgi:hypothetical protein